MIKLPNIMRQLNDFSTQPVKIGIPQYAIRTVEKYFIASN